MRKFLKWLGIGLGVLVGLLLLAGLVLYIMGGLQLNKTRQVQAATLDIPKGEAALARGEHLVDVACRSCHGQELNGEVLIDDPMIGTVYAPNITGLSGRRSAQDVILAVRHAIGQGNRQLLAMPSDAFINFSAEDLGSIIAYLMTVPPAGNEAPEPQFSVTGRILLGTGMMGDLSAAGIIDHNQPFSEMPEVGANLEYGSYLSSFCTSCHGPDLSGAQPPIQGSPIAPNLTPGGGLSEWSQDDFIQTIRTGVTPHGHELDPEYMPWKSWAKFYDEELQAIWIYLESLPALEMSME